MSRARLVITAVIVEGRTQAVVARTYGVSEGWVSKLLARYRAEGEAAFEPRSRRPKGSPTATPRDVVEYIVELRVDLVNRGLDAGARTIAWHLRQFRHLEVAPATINRVLAREGLVTAQPKKRPRSSFVRFEADLPNECWQADFTHYRLARRNGDEGLDVEILTFLDDHSRLILHMSAHVRVTGPIVVAAFREAVQSHGVPASTLTDNGMVFTTRFSGGKGGRNGFETELQRLGVVQKNSRPNHPTTCGKVERVQQTLKKWLDKRRRPSTIAGLQRLLEEFKDEYNSMRPHSSLHPVRTPASAYLARPKAAPGDRSNDRHSRVRHDIVDQAGKVTLRIDGQLHSIGIGRHYARTHVILLVQDLDVRVVDATTGELLRELRIDLSKRYHGTGKPPGPPPKRCA
jgi:transposase InsO family protein